MFRVILGPLESQVPSVLQEGRDQVDSKAQRERMDDAESRYIQLHTHPQFDNTHTLLLKKAMWQY